MFTKLKSLFRRQEAPPAVDVSLPKLLDWFDRRMHTPEMEREFQQYVHQIGQLLKQMRHDLAALEQAEVKEDDAGVDQKVKNIVLGHRSNYLREMRRFVELVELPQTYTLGGILHFHAALLQYLDDIAQRTVKSYPATQHLFSEEVESVVETLRQFSQQTQEFTHYLEQRGLHLVQDTRQQILSLMAIKKQQEKFHLEVEQKQQRLQQLKEHLEKTERQWAELKEGEEYHFVLAMQDKKRAVEEDLENVGQDVFAVFSPLSRIFRKYEKLIGHHLAGQYARDPVAAFYRDGGLEVVQVLEGLRQSLENGSLVLDDEEKEKVLSVMDKLTVAFFHEVLGTYHQLQEQKEDLQRQLSLSGVQNKLQECTYKIEHFDGLSEKFTVEIQEANAAWQSLHLDEHRLELEKVLQSVLHQQVNVLLE